MFLSSYRNTSGGLGEREMLWEHKPQASVFKLFRVLPNLHECFYNSIETRRKCFLFLLENSARKITINEENLIVLFIIKTYILYTTQCTRHLNLNFFVFLSSYRNTIINQSARVFSLSYFLKKYRALYRNSRNYFYRTSILTLIPFAPSLPLGPFDPVFP